MLCFQILPGFRLETPLDCEIAAALHLAALHASEDVLKFEVMVALQILSGEHERDSFARLPGEAGVQPRVCWNCLIVGEALMAQAAVKISRSIPAQPVAGVEVGAQLSAVARRTVCNEERSNRVQACGIGMHLEKL